MLIVSAIERVVFERFGIVPIETNLFMEDSTKLGLSIYNIKNKVLPSEYDFEAHKKLVPMQKGDVPITYADTSDLERDFGYKPSTPLRDGLRKFAEWYYAYYNKER